MHGAAPIKRRGSSRPRTFFERCEAKEIDTNYLRLLSEISGFVLGRSIGTLPYRDK
ncbi:hypothetical protein YK56LOC_70920 [Caballeronia sp. HLA56]